MHPLPRGNPEPSKGSANMAKQTNTERQGYNIMGACCYIGTSKSTLLKMLADGTLAHSRYGKRVFISRTTLDKFSAGEK